MAEIKTPEFDWSNLIPESKPVERKHAPTIRPVPDEILALARVWAANFDMEYPYSFRGNEAAATRFQSLAGAAGPHMVPPVTIVAKRDGILVTVYATTKRGRKPKNGNGDPVAE
jgi:hypothetical protein